MKNENPPLAITSLSSHTRSRGSFVDTLATSGGVPPYTYTMTPGPQDIPGLRLQNDQPLPTFSSSTGALIGVLAEAGVFAPALRDRRRPDGRPGGAGIFQRRAGHGRARFHENHVYFQSPNRFANLSPDFPHGPRAGGGSYQPKHSPLCCTAALNRILPWYVTHMWMATGDNGLAATCYEPCKVTALAANRVPVEITCKTDYPFNETIEMSVRPARAAAFPLDLRIPGWCPLPRSR